jgi:hypothetical protein
LKYFYLLLLAILLTSVDCLGQNFSIFEAEFSIKEKYKKSQKSTLFKGKVLVNTLEQTSKFDLFFPNRETWILKDSILSKFQNDTLTKKVNVGHFDNFSMIKEISSAIKKDYGLSDLGFTISDITEDSIGIVMNWLPPTAMKSVFSNAVTIISDNLLKSITLYDLNGNIVANTFFEDYQFLKNIPIPSRVFSKISGDTDTVFKSLQFNNIKINHQ